jgi:CPA2 family monovalent cation:H+ antiporter-2
MHEHLLVEILLLLAVTVIMVALFRRLRLPPLIGYLLVGVLVGPNGLAWLADAAEVRFMAELGVMFLMFLLGLEFSLPVLMSARAAVFGLGGSQVVVTATLAGFVAHWMGLPWTGAVAVGGAVAMSSTALLIKQLADQGDLNTRHGRMIVGVLLFQDLATLPFLVALPVLATGENGIWRELGGSLAVATAVFLAMVAAGRWFAARLLRHVATTRSAELFLLTAMLLIFGSAAIAESAGLPMPLGAFLAGMVIGETPYRHQVESDIRPFQDVLLGLFFITIGMRLDPQVLIAAWDSVLVLVAGIIVGKALVVMFLGLLGRPHPGVVVRAAVSLGHVGEFGMLLMALAMNHGLVAGATGQIILAAMIVSMLLAPLFVRWNYLVLLGLNLFGYREDLARQEREVEEAARGLRDHVILCGYSRIGQNLARFCEIEGLPFIAVDLDADRVHHAQAAGEPVLYGDAGRFSLLQAAGIERAKALAITFRDLPMAMKVLRQVQQHHRDLPVLARASDVADLERLHEAGATDVVPETVEASLVMGAQLLLLMGIPSSRVESHSTSIRGDQYRPLRGFFRGRDTRDRGEYPEELRALCLDRDAYAVDRSLGELGLGQLGVQLLAVRRGAIRVPEPTLDTSFRCGDTLVLYGRLEALDRAERLLLSGRLTD